MTLEEIFEAKKDKFFLKKAEAFEAEIDFKAARDKYFMMLSGLNKNPHILFRKKNGKKVRVKFLTLRDDLKLLVQPIGEDLQPKNITRVISVEDAGIHVNMEIFK